QRSGAVTFGTQVGVYRYIYWLSSDCENCHRGLSRCAERRRAPHTAIDGVRGLVAIGLVSALQQSHADGPEARARDVHAVSLELVKRLLDVVIGVRGCRWSGRDETGTRLVHGAQRSGHRLVPRRLVDEADP